MNKLRQANGKQVFNVAVAGQGSDIHVTSAGQAKTTFSFTPADLPRQLQNRLLGHGGKVRLGSRSLPLPGWL